jgi:DNA-damage-inducible protein D
LWHKGEWYWSIVDVIAILTDSPQPRVYWSQLKERVKNVEGFDEALVQIEQLRLKASDGRFRLTDTANRQTLLRIIQSIPSPRAEPFRLWLAQVGEERFEEIEHPEAALGRVRAMYRAKGYDDAWIDARIKNDLIRNELTDEWKERGAKEGVEYAILTNELSKGTFGLTVAAYKDYKLLPTRTNLRDHMTPIELALTSLSEATSVTYHRERDSQGFPELKRDTTDAGRTTGKARKAIEDDMGHSVLSRENYLNIKRVESRQSDKQKRINQSDQLPLLDDTPDISGQ